jgi:hypothetical protein
MSEIWNKNCGQPASYYFLIYTQQWNCAIQFEFSISYSAGQKFPSFTEPKFHHRVIKITVVDPTLRHYNKRPILILMQNQLTLYPPPPIYAYPWSHEIIATKRFEHIFFRKLVLHVEAISFFLKTLYDKYRLKFL